MSSTNLSNEYSADEKGAVEELRTRMEDLLTPKLREDPSLFYRFLKARNFDVNKAEKMLQKHLRWRKVYQADTLPDEFKPKEYFYKYTHPTIIGFDKDGDKVLYSASGDIVTAEVMKCVTFNEYMKSWVWYCESNLPSKSKRDPNQTQEIGKDCNQTSFIIDLKKLTMSNVLEKTTAEAWLYLTCLLQDNFPERMKAAYAINAPAYYVVVFSVMKAMMSGAMIQKIHVYGENGWKEKFLDIIDADVLPAFLGGNRTDPDGNPLCLNSINHSGRIPLEYYLSEEDRYFKDKSQIKSVIVPHSDIKEIFVDVTEIGSIIEWEFFVKKKDIGFGLFLEISEDETEEIIPIEKISTSDGAEKGFFKARSIGKYVIIFDNCHSWIIAKEVEYTLNVIKPK